MTTEHSHKIICPQCSSTNDVDPFHDGEMVCHNCNSVINLLNQRYARIIGVIKCKKCNDRIEIRKESFCDNVIICNNCKYENQLSVDRCYELTCMKCKKNAEINNSEILDGFFYCPKCHNKNLISKSTSKIIGVNIIKCNNCSKNLSFHLIDVVNNKLCCPDCKTYNFVEDNEIYLESKMSEEERKKKKREKYAFFIILFYL